MNGQRVIVTGATSGIGKEIARGLVQGGASVAIVGRNPAKLAATVDELGGGAGSAAAAPRVKIDTYTADLSELTAVRALAAELHERESHINVLVNNAGINLGGGAPTSDGYDPMLATNYLSPWLLTNLVLDLLAAGRPARIVNVASEAHRIADRIDPAHLTTFDTTGNEIAVNRAYGRTKLELILFTQELAGRVKHDGITVNAVCPGLVATNLAGERSPFTRVADLLSVTPLVRRPAQGAALPLALATDAKYDGVSGQFFSSTPGAGLLPTHPPRKDIALQRDLWAATEALLKL